MCHEVLTCSVGQARILAKDCVLDASLVYGRDMRHLVTEVTYSKRTYMSCMGEQGDLKHFIRLPTHPKCPQQHVQSHQLFPSGRGQARRPNTLTGQTLVSLTFRLSTSLAGNRSWLKIFEMPYVIWGLHEVYNLNSPRYTTPVSLA
jgi:hypothetical protein